MAIDYSNTLNLPTTGFSMRANLPQKEPELLNRWAEMDIYKEIMDKNKDKPLFVLHDGPPYANGNIHIGTALNKILKDFIVKYKNMTGFNSPYVPGWDCHGLPTESGIIKKYKIDRNKLSVAEFRDKCRDFAMSFVDIQRNQFKRLGVVGDWDNPYITLLPEFEAKQVEVFGAMAKKGYIYKGLKPVYWCPHDTTALAEAEIEYVDAKCDSIYVKFPVKDDKGLISQFTDGKLDNVYFVIWTTTTWTLPANNAVCLGPNFEYSIVKANNEYYVLATELIESVCADAGISEYEIVGKIKGRDFEGMEALHPFFDRVSYVIIGDHVTLESGTGCVHTASGHGADDFIVCQKYDYIETIVPVDEHGKMNELAGKYCGLTTDEANKVILADMKESGALLAVKEIVHPYPHCWRCKNPIIFRATEQWFASVSDMLEDAVKSCDDISWHPKWGKERMVAMISERSDWCISRQRNWGVPLPIFYCEKCGKEIITDETISRVSSLFREHGSNIWFEKEADELIPAGTVCPICGHNHFTKEKDIMDVWFDSGSTHAAVLDARPELKFPADIYLEGGDQYRGWFQSSLLTSIASKGVAPYKQIITHGWTVDGEGKAMHKSLGNAIAPEEVIDKFGADILRLWVSSVDYTNDVKISNDILKQLSDVYRKIRNTSRIILANLGSVETDFDPDKDMIPDEELENIDKWALSRLNGLVKRVREAYDNYEFHYIFHDVNNFCTIDMSKLYIDITKDRLYVERKDAKTRRAVQTVMYKVLNAMTRMISPILTFTAEEIWATMPHTQSDDKRSVLLNQIPEFSSEYNFVEIEEKYNKLFDIREDVMKSLELARADKIIGKPLEAKLVIYTEYKDVYEMLSAFGGELASLFIVSQVELINDKAPDDVAAFGSISVKVTKAEGEKCDRCWMYTTDGTDVGDSHLCARCKSIIG